MAVVDSSSVLVAGADWLASPTAARQAASHPALFLPHLDELCKARFPWDQEEITPRVAAVLEVFRLLQEGPLEDRLAAQFLRASESLAAWATAAQQPSLAQTLRQTAHDFQAIYDSPLDLDQESLQFLWGRLAPELAALRDVGERRSQSAPEASTVSVRLARLEPLIDRVSKLTLTAELYRDLESRLATAQIPHALREEMRQINREFQAQATAIAQGVVALRRVPIADLLAAAARRAAALAAQQGQRLTLQLSGENTEINPALRGNLEAILARLVDHAVPLHLAPPTPPHRPAAAEPGPLRLEAHTRNSRLHLMLVDDVALDPGWLRTLAVRQGLLPAETEPLSDEATLELLAHPNLALPGVAAGGGLAAVAALLEPLEGAMRVTSSADRGTVIRLEIPLRDTVRAIDTLLVQHAGQHFAIPFDFVLEIFELGAGDLKAVQGRRVVPLRGTVYDALSLSEIFHLNDSASPDSRRPGVLVEYRQEALCLLVDRVLGHRQAVVQPLEGLGAGNAKLAGVSPLGGGRLALVLNIPGILQSLSG